MVVLTGLAVVRWLQQAGPGTRPLAPRWWSWPLCWAAGLGWPRRLSLAFRLNKFTNQVMMYLQPRPAVSAGRPHFRVPRPAGQHPRALFATCR
ncbi:MAG: hypothetical protein WKG07_33685 [Hymenobacter sp.]